jgi:hypothetical protein
VLAAVEDDRVQRPIELAIAAAAEPVHGDRTLYRWY